MNIQLDIDDLIAELNLPVNTADAIVENAVEAVTIEVYRNWSLEAANGLNSTRQGYIDGLEAVKTGDFSRVIRLNGQLNNMLEKGASAFDMKTNFEKSAKVKWPTHVTPNGTVTSWYLTIPFRIGVPTTIGDNPAFSGIMPQEVYDVMRTRKADVGLNKTEIPSPFDTPQSRRPIVLPTGVVIPRYNHKHSIYEGMVKKTAAYGKTTQNTYMTFRRVSANSDPNSWIHRGIVAGNFLQKAIAATDLDTIVENSVDKTLSNLGYGN